jgi:hypothetical protein
MPRHSQICTVCQHIDENLIVKAGEVLPCSKCGGETERMWGGTAAVHGDDIPGGRWFENGFSEPRKFYSHSEHRAALAAEGCEMRPKWVPGDKHLTRWDIPCETTLANAKSLLERGAQAVVDRRKRWPNASIPISVTEGAPFRIAQDK